MFINKPFKPLLLVSAMIIGLSACNDNDDKDLVVPTPPPQQIVDYQQVIDEAVDGDLPGVILAIESPEISFVGSAGVSNLTTLTPMQIDDVMPTGSSGKKATALLAAMLHRDGLLNIDDTIDTWLPEEIIAQIENSETITLRQLLNHTAGVYDYLDPASSAQWYEALISDPESLKTDSFALDFALNKPAYFEPGEGFHYSNTHYLLAGLIMDSVLGEHHSVAMRNRIFIPLGLNHTYYNGLEKELGSTISGYVIFDEDLEDSKVIYENVGVADAPLVSSVQDMNLLLNAILTDDSVIGDDVREILIGEDSMVEINANDSYGLGLFKEMGNGRTAYHHGGDEPGYKTENYYLVNEETTISMFVNCNGYEACINQSQQLMQSIVVSLLK
ncbi:serine hydrolase [Glaciecola sp. KUL10]|uniref:serine hydrolase domain-containing protein n=1 Tax=Glaciecola sp. (strain KUL10) TaxID=2161813 RepID=UPI000D789F2B|nr:serine hydrolase domain-containing protein [Glaciecola sp. KUL10]GBL05105.1 serine-type D-Ala-D-Ala carboxypeptidase [Glaciecola sp. KUL10]